MKGRGKIRAAALFSVLIALSWTGIRTAMGAEGSPAASFYKDKTIRLIVGYSPGGGFDTFGRLVARYLGESIPGKPKVIVSLSAANRVYHTKDPDGLTLRKRSDEVVSDPTRGVCEVQGIHRYEIASSLSTPNPGTSGRWAGPARGALESATEQSSSG